jgi:hypothetical protein
LTDTPAVRGDLTPEQIEAARQAITIAFLASTRAGYITGAVIAPTAVKLERTPEASYWRRASAMLTLSLL